MPLLRKAQPGGERGSLDAVRRDYAPLAADYEERWRGFNAAGRDWVLARWPDLAEGARVVDLGCGTGGFLAMLAARHPDVTLVGLDATPALLTKARVAVPDAMLVEGDMRRPPFASGAFEVVCSLNVIHHLDDAGAHIADLARLCRPGGTIFVVAFAGGRNLLMRFADGWQKLVNPAWRGMSSVARLAGVLAGQPRLRIAEQSQIKADAWWWLQLYRLEVGSAG